MSQFTAYGVFVCLCCSWLYATANVCNRKLKDVHFTVIGFYHPMFGTVVYSLYVLTFGESWVVRPWSMYVWVVLAGFLDWIGFNLRNIAF